MGEDMTYATEPTRAQLAARVAELETALREQCALDIALIAQRAELERERDELRARLDAVPTTAFLNQAVGYIYEEDSEAIAAWIATLRPQALTAPDNDTDAPLKLAKLDEDDE